MKQLLAITILLFFSSAAFCQDELRTQLTSNFFQVNSVDPKQTDFSDLEIIGKAIGESRIVFLGEQDHGDAPTFLAKTRLIKYLHENMGFDVLVFEGDFWGLNEIWNNHQSDTFSFNQVNINTYDIWAKCLQTQELYQYIGQTIKTNHPLNVSGIDCRHASKFSKSNFITSISTFTKSQPSFITDTSSLNQFLNITDVLIKKEYDCKLTKKQKEFFFAFIDKVTPTIKDQFWKQEFINLKAGAINSWEKFSMKSVIRDVSMADNLLWLYHQKYHGSKIIVWAHDGHIAKNISTIPKQNSTSLGNEIFKSLSDSIYVLGFTSLTGKSGRIQFDIKFDVQKAKPNSFEDCVSTSNFEYGFINFKTMTITKPFDMKALDHWAFKANWTKVYDGIFYIKTMYPCDKIN